MVKITKKADYGLTLLAALASRPQEMQSLRSISESNGLPYKFIGQVASSLLEAGIVTSKEGATGGYKLAKEAKDISLKQVLEVLEGPVVRLDCLCGKKCSRQNKCTQRHIFSNLRDALNQSLSQKSLADLISHA